MYGSSGMYLNASFPGHETTTVTAPVRGRLSGDDDDDEAAEEGAGVWVEGEDGRCRRVQVRG